MVNVRGLIYRLLLAVLAVLVACDWSQGQFIGYVSPQTTQQTMAAAQACTGSAQVFAINNIGQTQHYLSISQLVNVQKFQAVIQGIDAQGNIFPISDVLEISGGSASGAVKGTGSWPKEQVTITCTPASTASFTAGYQGGWGTFDVTAGSYLLAQIDKTHLNGVAENANQSDSIQTPSGSSAGTLFFKYSAAGAGGTLSVQCGANTFNVAAGPTIASFTLANTTSLQVFQVPDTACPTVQVSYANNGQAGTVIAEYVFAGPGAAPRPSFQYNHQTGTTAAVIKGTLGFLHTVTINTGGAGTLSVFDLASGSCTGTPATNIVAVITAVAGTLQTFTYDSNLLNGICLKASVAMDYTVSFQ